jgi:small conductance mechanosensitive channel
MSALAFAIGMALSGFMNNILAGLVIVRLAARRLQLLFAHLFLQLTGKPFVVGDYIVGGGAEGVVKEITLTHTYIMSGDNKKQIVPNLPLATGTVVNASKNDTRRVDMVFGIAHEADLKDTREMFKRILKNHPAVLKEPAFVVEPDSLTPHGVNWLVRPWCKGSDYWTVHFDVHEAVHKTADELGISIPCPQSDVHLFKHTSEGAAAAADEDADGAPSVIVTTTSTTIVEPVTTATATTTTPTPGGPTSEAEGGEEKKDKSKSTKSKDKGAEKKKTK